MLEPTDLQHASGPGVDSEDPEPFDHFDVLAPAYTDIDDSHVPPLVRRLDASDDEASDDGSLSSAENDGIDSEDGAITNDSIPEDDVMVCHNCHRQDIRNDRFKRMFINCSVEDIPTASFKKAFCTISSMDDFPNGSVPRTKRVTVCAQCCMYLKERDMGKNLDRFRHCVWPVIMWTWLSGPHLVSKFGHSLWRLIPETIRPWWINQLPLLYKDCTLTEPPALLSDVTNSRDELCQAIETNELSGLVSAVEKYLLPTVKCPYGCNEFLHKTQSAPFDVVVAGLLGRHGFPIASPPNHHLDRAIEEVDSIQRGARSDVLDLDAVGNELLLSNPSWVVKPALYFGAGAPVMLCCRHHGFRLGGKRRAPFGQRVHPAKDPLGCIPSAIPDQLSHAVLKCRTIKPVRAHKYSNTYSMEKMKGSFGGVDTIDLGNVRNLHHDCTILREREAIYLAERKDLKLLAEQLAEDPYNPQLVPQEAESMMAESGRLMQLDNFRDARKRCIKGSSSLILKDTAFLQEQLKCCTSRSITLINEPSSRGDGSSTTVQFNPCWPPIVVYSHPDDLYGQRPHSVPRLDGKLMQCIGGQHRLLNMIISSLLCVQDVWCLCDKSVSTTTSWCGSVLRFISKRMSLSKNKGRDGANQKFSCAKKSGGKKAEETELCTRLGIVSNVGVGVDNPCYSGLMREMAYLHFNRLFSVVDGVAVVTVDGNIDGMHISSSHAIVMVFQGTQPSPVPGAQSFGSEFDLCFLYCLDRSHEDISDFCAMRHGAPFSGWWGTESKPGNKMDACFRKIEDGAITDSVGLDWDFAVFVRRKSNVELERYRDCLLRSIGGQTYVQCALHKKPLISSLDNRRIRKDAASPVTNATMECGVLPMSQNQNHKKSKDDPVNRCCCLDALGAPKCMASCKLTCADPTCSVAVCTKHLKLLVGRRVDDGKLRIANPFVVGESCDGFVLDDFLDEDNSQNESVLDNTYEEEDASYGDDSIYSTDSNNPGGVATASQLPGPVLRSQEGVSNTPNSNNPEFDCAHDLYYSNADEEESDCELQESTSFSSSSSSSSRGSLFSVDTAIDSNQRRLCPDGGDVLTRPQNYTNHVEEEQCMERESDVCLPFTNVLEPDITTREGQSTAFIMGSHVILNNTGSVLNRKTTKIKANAYQQHHLEGLASRIQGECVPLFQPEAMFCPSAFPFGRSEDGTTMGSLPCSLLAEDSFATLFGFAPLVDQIWSRMSNHSLLCHSNPRYISYAFDSVMNMACRSADTRLVLNRGFSEVVHTNFGPKMTSQDSYDVDLIDSRATLNKLAASCAEKQPTYFYTTTCNMLEHFGIGKVKRWIDGDDILDFICRSDDTEQIRAERRRGVQLLAAPLFCRLWAEVSHLWMVYIVKSKERPLGKIVDAWWRYEFQDGMGNLPHIHALLCRDPDDCEMPWTKIQGSYSELLTDCEADVLVNSNLANSRQECHDDAYKWGATLLRHHHTDKCFKRVGPGDAEIQCRATNNGFLNPEPTRHTIVDVDVSHSAQAEEILLDLGLFVKNEKTGLPIPNPANKEACRLFGATRHFPPAVESEGCVSACNGLLFAITKSSQNVQFVANTYLLNRYLTKYMSQIDEHNRVIAKASPSEGNAIHIEAEYLHNTKLGTSKHHNQRRWEKSRDFLKPSGRAISQMEMLWFLHGYGQVVSTFKYSKVPTCPLENRCGIAKISVVEKLQDDGKIDDDVSNPNDLKANILFPMIEVRQSLLLDKWRQVGETQKELYLDSLFSNVSVDRVTLFGLRPPELRAFGNQVKYARWFWTDSHPAVKNPCTDNDIAEVCDALKFFMPDGGDLCKSYWIDAMNKRVYVREDAVPEILKYLHLKADIDFYPREFVKVTIETEGRAKLDHIMRQEKPRQKLIALFKKLGSLSARRNQMESEKLREIFFGPPTRRDPKLPIVWYSGVRPTQPAKWIIHLILTMGEFDVERNVFMYGGSLRGAIQEAGLVRDIMAPDIHDQVRQLTRRYITEQLAFTPGGTKTFDFFVVTAYNVLVHAIERNQLFSSDNVVPPCLYTKLRDEATEKIQKEISSRKRAIVKAALSILGQNEELRDKLHLPELNEICEATTNQPVQWSFELTAVPGQTDDSLQMQQLSLRMCEEMADQYVDANGAAKSHIMVGGPGTGKTTMMLIQALMLFCYGFNGIITAILSDRAKTFGGEHISRFLCVPVNENVSPLRLAELAVLKLLHMPWRIAFIRTLDFMCIDELGVLSAEMLFIMDTIFRIVRANNLFMGGVMIVGSMDKDQLLPVDGRPFLTSPYVLFSFRIISLISSIRAVGDRPFQRLQEICKIPSNILLKQKEKIKEFKQLVMTVMTHVDSFDDPVITPCMLRLFGKKDAIKAEEERMILSMENKYRATGQFLVSQADDWESKTTGNWGNASSVTSKRLSREVKEPEKLAFWPGAAYEVTFNGDTVSQSQLCILDEMPSQTIIDNKNPIRVLIAPNGVKTVPEGDHSKMELIATGWKPEKIGKNPKTNVHSIGKGIMAKREQYGLKHRIASTIHVGMGQDLQAVVTKVSATHRRYQLWDKRQLIVLTSRTHKGKDTIFVGDKEETAEYLASLLTIVGHYDSYMHEVVQNLSINVSADHTIARPRVLDIFQHHPFRPNDVAIAQATGGYVYLLVSTKDTRFVYIGETSNLLKRFDQHHRGVGANITSNPSLKPWGIVAYVCGFQCKQDRKDFEAAWKYAIDREILSTARDPFFCHSAARVGENVMKRKGWNRLDLQMIRTGKIESPQCVHSE